MTKIAIVRDSKRLNAQVSQVIAMYTKAYDALWPCFVSCLYHAAHTGHTQPLNRLYLALNTNDQSAIRQSFLNRVHAYCGGIDFSKLMVKQDTGWQSKPIPTEQLQQAQKDGRWLGYSTADKNEPFFVVSRDDFDKAPANRKKAEKLIETILTIDDEELMASKGWKKFFHRNNLAEQSIFGNADVLKAVKAIQTKMKGSDRITAKVDDKVKKQVDGLVSFMESYIESNVGVAESESIERSIKRGQSAAATRTGGKSAARSLEAGANLQ